MGSRPGGFSDFSYSRLPGANLVDTRLLGAFAELREQFLREDWPASLRQSMDCVGLACVRFRELRAAMRVERPAAEVAAASVELFEAMLEQVAESGMVAEFLNTAREHFPDDPELVSELESAFGALESDEPADISAILQLDLFETDLDPPHDMAVDTTVAVLSRGLLGWTHARFNLAFWQGAGSRQPRPEAVEDRLREETEAMAVLLRAGQSRVYAALVNMDREQAARAALDLAGSIEEQLPPFADLQAEALHAMRQLRTDGRGGASTRLGEVAARAGAWTREALASHAACYLAALELEGDARSLPHLYARAAEIPFHSRLPRGRIRRLAHLTDEDDGSYVHVRGFVTALQVLRKEDGKLVGRAELIDAASKTRIRIATPFTHFRHLGITRGSFVEASGTYRVRSNLLERSPAVEVERMSLAQLARESWRVAFLSSADRFFRCWPNGVNMSWSPGPQRKARTEGEVEYLGAAEVTTAPLARGRGGK